MYMQPRPGPWSLLAILIACAPAASAAENAKPPGKELIVYHIGNSLTRNIPLERLQQLFEAAGGKYEYGMQLGGGMRLEQHLVKRSHGGPPGSAKYNLVEKYGPYEIHGDPEILEPLDALLKAFVDQGRMKLPGSAYVPCYKIVREK